MKKWLCWLMLLMLTTAAACAEQTSAGVEIETVSLTIKDCRIETWQPDQQEIRFAWEMRNVTDEMEGYFFDIGDAAYSGTAQDCSWEVGYDLRPGDADLAMGYLPAMYDQWVLNEEAVLSMTSEEDNTAFPFRLAFYVDVYKPLMRTSDLRLDVLRWSMTKESDRIFVARPDVPELNDGLNTPKTLLDFASLMQKGDTWEERLAYQRDRAQLRRTLMKINGLGKPLAAWEVRITFDGPDRPGTVEISEVE